MLIVIIPVEAVAATTTNAASDKGHFAPEGGTYYGFYPIDPTQSYPLDIIFLPKKVTYLAILCMKDKNVLEYIAEAVDNDTIVDVAVEVAKMLGVEYAAEILFAVEIVVGFAMWGFSQWTINRMKDARDRSADEKLWLPNGVLLC